MLPPGHIAAGFLTAEVLLKIIKPNLSPQQIRHLVYWGMFFSFAPDLDNFVAFGKIRAWWYKKGVDNTIHRKFYSHIPILWLITGLLIYFFASSEYLKIIGLLLWVCSWSHFLLDSIDFGVMWLWPLNKDIWALNNRGIERKIEGKNFADYWLNFLKFYSTTWTFYTEIIIIIVIALIIYFN